MDPVIYMDAVIFSYCQWSEMYRQISNIRRTIISNNIVDHSDV